MPKAYWVVTYKSVKNPEAWQAYAKLAAVAIQGAGGRFIVRNKPAKTYEAGLNERVVLYRHALKNAILPTLTLMGVQFGFLFGGSLLVEVIYSYPGMGNLMVDAVRNADLPIIQLVGLTYCVVVLLINSLVDGLYLVLNPRLRR